MTEPAAETPNRVRWLRRARYFLLAALLGTVAGFAAVYLTGGLKRNAALTADPSCTAAARTAERLKTLAKGEVAAFTVNQTPKPATAISFTDGKNQPVSLSHRKGKAVLVNLWATWCVPCRKEMPALDELQQKLGGADFEVVAINLDTRDRDKPRRFLEEIKVKHLAYYEDAENRVFQTLRAAERAPGLPSTILIDRNGCELGFLLGPAEWASADALALIREALKPN
jgi:thiol-disulfide isomerase/thioredoxin